MLTKSEKNQYENELELIVLNDAIANQPLDVQEEIKSLILNSPEEVQRKMIFNILGDNNITNRKYCMEIDKLHNQIIENKNEASNSKYTLNSYSADILKYYRDYIKVAPTEVKQFGEVMTPIELVESMLDTLPYDVWTNPNLKWLDPCNGIGTFYSVIINRLMSGLQSSFPDPDERYKHIMENMIYSCELQSKNCFLYMYAFDPKDEFAINIYNGSFLIKNFKNDVVNNIWGLDKFDIIVMNPPYNDGNPNRGSAHVLWDKFVINSLDILKEGGYLVAVHPDGWRSYNGGFKNVQNILKEKQITYLELHNTDDGIKTFGASTTYDFYCLHNVPNTMYTTIKCQDGKIERVDLSKMEFIPNGMFSTFNSLMAKNGEEKVNVLRDCKYHTQKEYISKEQTNEFKYPVVYTVPQSGIPNLIYSSTNQNGHFGIPKVIWSNGGASCPFIDENGEYSISEFSYAIIDEPKNLPFIQKAMLHPDFIKLMSFSDGTGHRYNRKVIALFRKDFWKEFLY